MLSKHGWISVLRAPPLNKPWMVQIRGTMQRDVTDGLLVGWRVWCPCCRQWTATPTFEDALIVVKSILPGAS